MSRDLKAVWGCEDTPVTRTGWKEGEELTSSKELPQGLWRSGYCFLLLKNASPEGRGGGESWALPQGQQFGV